MFRCSLIPDQDDCDDELEVVKASRQVLASYQKPSANGKSGSGPPWRKAAAFALERLCRTKGAACRVYCAILLYAYSSDEAWPSQETLVEKTGCSLKTVSRAVKALVDIGVIEVFRHQMGVNHYRFVDTSPMTCCNTSPVTLECR